jgi:predicted transcriptional regulator
MRKTQTLNLRVSPDFKRRLIEEARKAKRSVTNYIEVALSEYWTQKGSGDKHRAKTKDGLLDHQFSRACSYQRFFHKTLDKAI